MDLYEGWIFTCQIFFYFHIFLTLTDILSIIAFILEKGHKIGLGLVWQCIQIELES